MKTAIPCVIWRKIDYPRSDHPNPSAERMYLRSDTDAQVMGQLMEHPQRRRARLWQRGCPPRECFRRLRTYPAITLGIEAAATVNQRVRDKEGP